MRYPKIWQKALVEHEQVRHEFSVGEGFKNLGIAVSIVATIIAVLIMIGLLALMDWPIWPAAVIGILMLVSLVTYFWFYLPIANAFALTDRRVIAHRGWLSTSAVTVDYAKITDVSVRDPMLERWLTNTGYVVINTAGGDQEEIVLSHVTRPFEIKKILDQLKDTHVHSHVE